MYKKIHIYSKSYTISTKSNTFDNFHFLSNPMTYPEYLYTSVSLFSLKITATKKQVASVG